MIDPYEAQVIPERDLYADSPLYGRYRATPADFDPADKTPQEILDMCRPDNEMMPTFTEGRTIYAVGRVMSRQPIKRANRMNSGTPMMRQP